jgi:hypothetical protein
MPKPDYFAKTRWIKPEFSNANSPKNRSQVEDQININAIFLEQIMRCGYVSVIHQQHFRCRAVRAAAAVT